MISPDLESGKTGTGESLVEILDTDAVLAAFGPRIRAARSIRLRPALEVSATAMFSLSSSSESLIGIG